MKQSADVTIFSLKFLLRNLLNYWILRDRFLSYHNVLNQEIYKLYSRVFYLACMFTVFLYSSKPGFHCPTGQLFQHVIKCIRFSIITNTNIDEPVSMIFRGNRNYLLHNSNQHLQPDNVLRALNYKLALLIQLLSVITPVCMITICLKMQRYKIWVILSSMQARY